MIKTRGIVAAYAVSMLVLIFAANAAAAELIIYPAKGQSESKMAKDKAECQQWAQKETGINPATPAPAPQAQSTSTEPKGERVRGGARGAAGGAAVGAIAGDAGKGAAIGAAAGGMRGGRQQREARREEKSSQQQAQAQQQQRMDTYNKAYSACLEGRGYSVK
ncbi:MAG: glycine zipper family protein [bacterium]